MTRDVAGASMNEVGYFAVPGEIVAFGIIWNSEHINLNNVKFLWLGV